MHYLQLLNQTRLEVGVPPLAVYESLNQSAQTKLEQVEVGAWTHEGYAETIEQFGRYRKVGEILAKDYSTEEKLYQGWIKSPGHYQTIIDPEFSLVGFAQTTYEIEGKEKVMAVVHFGSPSTRTEVVQPTPMPSRLPFPEPVAGFVFGLLIWTLAWFVFFRFKKHEKSR